ncbi:MAG: alpha/beta hydrolase [Deltaproteobacteria bacterium]|nr:alpha/beta hydrolase [Deltaproteobacteria bacterium]
MKKMFKKMMFWIPIIIVSVYLFLCVAIYIKQADMVYHPTSDIVATPDDWGIPFEDIAFRAKDNTALHGWFLKGDDDAPTILFCHGNAGNISGREQLLTLFHELHVNVFIFDYRGYGKSEGSPSEKGTVEDVTAAWDLLREQRQIAPERIVIFGRSLGGGVATHLASRVRFAGLILMSTFTAVPDAGQAAYPFLPIRLLSKYEYPNLKHIKSIQQPVLFFHGLDDKTIPFSHGRQLFEAAPGPKTFVELPGGHNDVVTVSRAKISQALQTFLNELFQSATH